MILLMEITLIVQMTLLREIYLLMEINLLTTASKLPSSSSTTAEGCGLNLVQGFYLTQSVFQVVLQKSSPPQIRQLILNYYQHKNSLTDVCGI